MSRTSVPLKENPCKKFLTWKTTKEKIKIGDDEIEKVSGGEWVYWDKNKGEKGENVPVKLPLEFAILNLDLVTFKGYDESKKRGVYSNEVKDKNHIVTIKTSNDKLWSFPLEMYKENKAKLTSVGAKYTKSVYIAVQVNGKFEIWNLQLTGAPLSGSPVDSKSPTEEEKKEGWFNHVKNNKNKLYTNYTVVNSFKLKKKGSNRFSIPVFEIGDVIDPEDGKVLDALDKELNEYLDFYFDRPSEGEKGKEEKPVAAGDVDDEDEDVENY